MSTPTVEELVSLIFETDRLIRSKISFEDEVDPFSMIQLETLKFVQKNGKPTMKDIADYFHITPPSATSLIEGLVNEDHLERIQDKKDRRIIRLEITPEGEKTMKEEMNKVADRMKKVLSVLNEEERKNMADILKTLSEEYKD